MNRKLAKQGERFAVLFEFFNAFGYFSGTMHIFNLYIIMCVNEFSNESRCNFNGTVIHTRDPLKMC